MKSAIIICGWNTAAAQSMAANLSAAGYENCDILSPGRDALALEKLLPMIDVSVRVVADDCG